MNALRTIMRLLLGERLPITKGTQSIPGIRDKIIIRRDAWGIPMIEAADDLDAAFAIGFCHGQDRAFQLEILLRVVRGMIADMAGKEALALDRLSRRIGFYRSAREQFDVLEDDVRQSLQAYARGVQAGIGLGSTHLAHEFSLVKIRPTPWHPVDTLAITKLLSFNLMANWDAELVRLKVLTTDGAQALEALDGAYPEWHRVISPVGARAGKVVDRLAEDLKAFATWSSLGGASNNWAISGSRTVTGRPILANDPHLDTSLPSHWYLASVRTPDVAVAGASFVGGPLFLAGHNNTSAWGLTAGLADNTDLFIEELGEDGTTVRESQGFVPCRIVEEEIPVKGSKPVLERVRITERGPIISESFTDTPQALSLRAVWLDRLPLVGFFRVPRVRSFTEFCDCFREWPVASQNMVYADVSGTIGWQLIGQLPVRKKGTGAIPLAGADPDAGWQEQLMPFEQMPRLRNPACGFVVTANNQHLEAEHQARLGIDPIDGYRYEAIHRALDHRQDWDVASTQQLQTDQYTVAWEEMRAIVLAVDPVDLDSGLALESLREWDGRVTATSPAASIYELFVAEMVIRVARAKAPKSWKWLVGASLSILTPYNFGCFRRTGHLVRLLREQPTGWFDHPWHVEIADALGEAVRRLNAKFGPNVDQWQWGKTRTLRMRHALSRPPGLLGRAMGAVFNLGPVPHGGDADVINQSAAPLLDPFAPASNVASLRVVIDVGQWHNSRFAIPGGQSGNPFSPHYGDLFTLWQKGQGVPIAFTLEEMQRAAVETLELTVQSEV